MNKIETEFKKVYTDGTKMAQDIVMKADSAKTAREVIAAMSEMSAKFKALKDKEDGLIKKYSLTQPEMDKILGNLKVELDAFSKSLESSGYAIGKSIGKYTGDKKVMDEFKKWQESMGGAK
jgi:hypothetical protein